jgi:hypothetical protein
MHFGGFFRGISLGHARTNSVRRRIESGDDMLRAARTGSVLSGLTLRERGGAVCIEPEQRAGLFTISKPQHRMRRLGQTLLSGPAAL